MEDSENSKIPLVKSEETFRSLVENSLQGFFIIQDFKCIYANKAIEDITGYSVQELLSMNFEDISNLIHPEDREFVLNRLKDRLNGKEVPSRYEYRIITKDGQIKWIETSPKLIQLNNKPAVQSVIVDITHRKKLEEELSLSKKRLESILNIYEYKSKDIKDLIDFALDEVLKLTNSKVGFFGYYNEEEKVMKIGAWSKEAMKECKVIDYPLLFHIDKAGIWAESIRQRKPFVLNDYNIEHPGKRGYPYGHVHITKLLSIPIFTDHKITAIVAVANKPNEYDENDIKQLSLIMNPVLEIIERRKIEEELKKLNIELEYKVKERTKELELSNKELESFAYTVSHDLRAPLRAINGYTTILLTDYSEKFDEEGKKICSSIIRNTKKMAQLIDELLLLSRIGRTVLTFTNIDMKSLVLSLYDEIVPKERKDTIEFIVNELHNIKGDNILLKQVWLNLISNAIKFTSKNERPIIFIESKEEKEYITYSIKDNGVGFDMRYSDKLFGVFQRLHSEKEFPGTGVGLAIVSRIIQKHNGKVWAEAELNKGATFYFSLPKHN